MIDFQSLTNLPEINFKAKDRPELKELADYIDKMKEGYQKIEPYIPDVDWQDQSIGHEWNKPLWGGTLGVEGEYDLDDDDYQLGINWGTTFG